MQLILASLANLKLEQAEDYAKAETLEQIKIALNAVIANHVDDFVQDMTHISEAATYDGNIGVDAIVHLKDNLYRCDYSYDWTIAWTCSGLQEGGRVTEKVRFNLVENGVLDLQFLKFD